MLLLLFNFKVKINHQLNINPLILAPSEKSLFKVGAPNQSYLFELHRDLNVIVFNANFFV
jgi:hypothetical protein